jgi:hypothetical protein
MGLTFLPAEVTRRRVALLSSLQAAGQRSHFIPVTDVQPQAVLSEADKRRNIIYMYFELKLH